MYNNISCLAILENLPIPVLVVDTYGNIKKMNLSSKNLLKKLDFTTDIEDEINICSIIYFYDELKYFVHSNLKSLNLEKKIELLNATLYFQIKINKIFNNLNILELITIVLYDITEQKKAELSLRQREEQLSSILDNMPVMMSVFDNNNNVVLWNKECENVTGYTKEEINSYKRWSEILYPDLEYRKFIFKKYESIGLIYKDAESDIICKDGSKKTISWFSTSAISNISNWSYIKFGVDITQRKVAETGLIDKTLEFESIFKALPDIYFRFNRDGICLDCKSEDLDDLISPQEELINRHIEDIHPNALGVKFKSAILKTLKTKSLVIFEYELNVKKGLQYFEARLLPISSNEVVSIVRNITKRKQVDEELLKIEKLNSIGTLAGGVAHDFNNILTIILGNISMLKTCVDSNDRIFKKLSDIEKTVFQAKSLTKQLLTFAKGSNPIKKVTYINNLIKETSDLALSGSNVMCHLSLPKNLWPVEVDTGQISQVISNLVINACQSMPNGGMLTIKAKNITLADNEIVGLSAGRYIEISVKDQGYGISEGNLLKIFDPYFTTKKTGSGLGLTSSYSIIKKHNGHIIAKSKVGKGTVFHIFIPACDSIPIEIEEPKSILIHGKNKILVMDDELEIREVLHSMLTHLGYKVELSKDGLEAINLYKNSMFSNEPFDAIIMDLTIPGGMGGEEAIKHLIKIDPKIKALVSSGYSSGGVMANYEKHGFKGVINKPYTLEELSNALNNLLSSC
ncbi:MAG: PAS domain S-box protein [Clostridium sp.]|nr:PAS domain S-box protein [Clostridium sp.]